MAVVAVDPVSQCVVVLRLGRLGNLIAGELGEFFAGQFGDVVLGDPRDLLARHGSTLSAGSSGSFGVRLCVV